MEREKVNILMVDDQPGKLLSYEVISERTGRKSDKGSFGKGSLRLSA